MTNPATLAQVARGDATVFEKMGYLAGKTQLLGDYTLGLVDKGWMIESATGSLITVTIPLEASVNFPINTLIHLCRFGAGDLAIAPTNGVVLYSAAGYRKISTQYGTATLWKRGSDEWLLSGVLKA